MKKITILGSSVFALFIMLFICSQSKGQSNTPASKEVSPKSESYEYAYSISAEEMAAMEADRIFERGYAYKKKATLSPKYQDKASGCCAESGTSCSKEPKQKYAALRKTVRTYTTQKK